MESEREGKAGTRKTWPVKSKSMLSNEIKLRLRRASAIIAEREETVGSEEVMWMAWDLLQGLGRDQFPEDLRPGFDFLNHELSIRKGQEMTPREISFLIERIRELEAKWIEPPEPHLDSPAKDQ